MKDKEWNAKRKQVKALFDKWTECLGLRWYQIDLEWKAGDGEDRGDGFVRCMEVRSRWMYRTATITIWLEELTTDEKKLERAVIHELCHILIEPMRGPDGVTDNEELVAESLASAFCWTQDLV